MRMVSAFSIVVASTSFAAGVSAQEAPSVKSLLRSGIEQNAKVLADESGRHTSSLLAIVDGSDPNKRPLIALTDGSDPNKRPLITLADGSDPNKRPLIALADGSDPNKRPLIALTDGSDPNKRPLRSGSVAMNQLDNTDRSVSA